MRPDYTLADPSSVFSPALLFYRDLIQRNLARALAIAGSPDRLRPHAKTHKTREIVRMALDAGVAKHKCATPAEAEMLAQCGAKDVLLAYPVVGPNCGRLARLAAGYPECRFAVLGDDMGALKSLSDAMTAAAQEVDVMVDLDVGQHRTGVAVGESAVHVYENIARLPGLRPGGLHIYDGHNHQENPAERRAAVHRLLEPVLHLRQQLEQRGLPVPRLVVGGTPTFPIYAKLDYPGLECSPGTCLVHDHGYGSRFLDVEGFTPAAVLLTRVISRPTANRITVDLGYKAVSSDPPAGKRCHLLNVPDYVGGLQNEEHFVVETPAAERFSAGDVIYAIPTHICPTIALHRQALIVENRQVTGAWDIVARDRVLTI
ncbi:MAG: D-TA family PLP-dependent enzyme [Gemmataceae bacterium]